MASPVVHFEIMGKDGEGLKDFYSKIFDWEINSDNPMNYGLVKEGEKGIGGGVGEAPEGMDSYVTFYIEVPDPQVCLDKIESMGGKTIIPITVIPNMATFALFEDPAGNHVGVVKSEVR